MVTLAQPVQSFSWGGLKLKRPVFVEADARKVRSLRCSASLQGQILNRRFSVKKCVRDGLSGVRVERVA